MVSVYQLDVLCDSCGSTVSLKKPENRSLMILLGVLIIGGISLAAGLVTGIATAGLGAPLAVVSVPAGIYAGYKTGGWAALKTEGLNCPECGHDHS